MKMVSIRTSLAVLAIPVFLFSAGCHVNVDKNRSGEDKVNIETPFGDVKVNTEVDARDIGLSSYPGAMSYRDADPKDKHSADVNISTGLFGLKVVVKEYRSDDTLDKIAKYYRGELKRYGNVIDCPGVYDHNVEANKGDSDGPVTCDQPNDQSGALQLKVGTQRKQHVVALKPDGSGTRFSLIYVNVRGKDDKGI